MLNCAHYPYNYYANFNIHKQAELTKNNGLDSSIVYRIHRVVMEQRTYRVLVQLFIFA